VIGVPRLEENEGLFVEASALADILGEVQLNTKELLTRHSLCQNLQRSMVSTCLLPLAHLVIITVICGRNLSPASARGT